MKPTESQLLAMASGAESMSQIASMLMSLGHEAGAVNLQQMANELEAYIVLESQTFLERLQFGSGLYIQALLDSTQLPALPGKSPLWEMRELNCFVVVTVTKTGVGGVFFKHFNSDTAFPYPNTAFRDEVYADMFEEGKTYIIFNSNTTIGKKKTYIWHWAKELSEQEARRISSTLAHKLTPYRDSIRGLIYKMR